MVTPTDLVQLVVADLNPITYAVDVARRLAFGTSVGSRALLAVGISLVLAAIGAASAAMDIRPLRRASPECLAINRKAAGSLEDSSSAGS